jgi:glucose-6-phosphate isomerase
MLASSEQLSRWITLASPEDLENFQLHEDDQIVFASKSGNTLELWSWLGKLLHMPTFEKLTQTPIVITETNQNYLHELSKTKKWILIEMPVNIGGRYSVFSPIGYLPLTWLGKNLKAFAQGGQGVLDEIEAGKGPWFNMVSSLHRLWLQQYIEGISDWVLMPYSRQLKFIGGWWTQLVSESLGKKSPDGTPRGITAIRAVGPQDQHAQLQRWLDGPKNVGVIFLSLSDKKKNGLPCLQPENSPYPFLSNHTGDDILRAQIEGTQSSLQEAGVPTYHIEIQALDEAQLGALMMAWQIIVALVGLGLEINPFDQPAIEAGKRKTLDKLRLP